MGTRFNRRRVRPQRTPNDNGLGSYAVVPKHRKALWKHPKRRSASALGAQDSIRFGDRRGCLVGQQRAPKSGCPDGYEIKVTCDSSSSRMLPDHQYPIPQREPLIRIIRNRRIIGSYETAGKAKLLLFRSVSAKSANAARSQASARARQTMRSAGASCAQFRHASTLCRYSLNVSFARG